MANILQSHSFMFGVKCEMGRNLQSAILQWLGQQPSSFFALGIKGLLTYKTNV